MTICPHCKRPKVATPTVAKCGCHYLVAQPFQGRKERSAGEKKYRYLTKGMIWRNNAKVS